jgi:PmbA protein
MSNLKPEEEVARLMQLAEDVMKRATSRGAEVAEVRARSGSELTVKVRMGETEILEEAAHRSIGMRVMKQKRVALTSTSDLSPEGLERFIADALELVDISQEDAFAGPADDEAIMKGPPQDLDLYDERTGDVTAAQALIIAKRGETAARDADSRISNSDGATYSRSYGCFAMALSAGFRGGYAGSMSSLSVVPVAEDAGGKKRRGFYYTAKRFREDLEDAEAVGKQAAKRTIRKLGARKVNTQEAPVIFDPDAARSILGLFASCAMGSAFWRKSTYLLGREGEVVTSPLLTIDDDPLMPRGLGSRPFDGEGIECAPRTIVDKGRLTTILCDSYSARKLGRKSTASASRSAGGGVGASTSNYILRPTGERASDIIRGTVSGLYVTEMMGFGFNPVTGDFSRGASGFWVDRGELAFPVNEVTISLNLDDLLKRIDAVGNDLEIKSSTASPTIRVSKMTIAGSSE